MAALVFSATTPLEAWDINASGQIIGNGLYDGQQRAFILTVIPEPATLSVLALGLPLLKRRRKL
ncbi:MAG TPA: hypothetical protein VNA25_15665 [Phycisphaerae bacterium]|nr:hypothetical protein [Phycisphaerae bacterium]